MFDNLRLYLTILFVAISFPTFRRPLYFSISVFLCACSESCINDDQDTTVWWQNESRGKKLQRKRRIRKKGSTKCEKWQTRVEKHVFFLNTNFVTIFHLKWVHQFDCQSKMPTFIIFYINKYMTIFQLCFASTRSLTHKHTFFVNCPHVCATPYVHKLRTLAMLLFPLFHLSNQFSSFFFFHPSLYLNMILLWSLHSLSYFIN